ncbi:hypothetical protein DLAC_04329 [Tieghemostelium lacteum]|uniref:Pesticidal crystal protein domain-containing protein n=1 Tax=Tieghemostelium lacteum TaxID=361077 RepID=A0A151ZJC3_TIELA|nr:hypothetical protein DLAC_04329 [Tieghemostelium lacteum]|eukprot:KYQ94056.1 hypothetical protein DLAC_04329 [Tieghemostelium lacteum]
MAQASVKLGYDIKFDDLTLKKVTTEEFKEHLQSLKTDGRINVGVKVAENFLSFSKNDLIAIMKGQAEWQDYAHMGATIATSALAFIPYVGPVVSILGDVLVGLIFSNIDTRNPIEPLIRKLVKEGIKDFLVNTCKGKLQTIQEQLQTYSLHLNNALSAPSNVQYQTLLIAAMDDVNTQFSDLTNNIQNQETDYKIYLVDLYLQAVVMHLSVLWDFISKSKLKLIKVEKVYSTNIFQKFKEKREIYLQFIHANQIEKLNRLMDSLDSERMTNDIKDYFEARSRVLQSMEAIWPLMFLEFGYGGVLVDNPVYHYKLEMFQPNIKHQPYNWEVSPIGHLKRPFWEVANEIMTITNNGSYIGDIKKLTVGFNTVSGQDMIGSLLTHGEMRAMVRTTNSKKDTCEKLVEKLIPLGWIPSVTLSNHYLNIKLAKAVSIGSEEPEAYKTWLPSQRFFMDPNSGKEIDKQNGITNSTSKYDYKVGQIFSINPITLLVPYIHYLCIGYSKVTDDTQNYVSPISTTVIGATKFAYAQTGIQHNLNDVYFGFNGVQLSNGEWLEYHFSSMDKSITTKFDVFVRVTVGLYKRDKMNLKETTQLSKGFEFVSQDDSTMTVQKFTDTATKVELPKSFGRYKYINIGTIDLTKSHAENIIIFTCTKGAFNIEAIIFRPIPKTTTTAA